MSNAIKIMFGTSSGILIGIGAVFLATIYSEIIGVVMGFALLISGISGLAAVKSASKNLLYASAISQISIGAFIFATTVTTKVHIFNLSWSLTVVLLALFSILLACKRGHA